MAKRLALLGMVVTGLLAHGAPAGARPRPAASKVRPPPPPRAPVDAPAPAAPAAGPARPAAATPLDTEALIARVRALYDSLEYDGVIPLAEEALARNDLTLEQKLEAYRLLGSAKAIVEDPVEAEKPFRLLLRARGDFELAAATPPKILAVFRKVQSEERALAQELGEVERERIISGLRLIGDPPREGRGGRPLPLSFRLRDATGAVETVRVPYRRQGTAVFSAVALERSAEGDWRGVIPGDFTSDEKGFTMEYFVETADAKGPLLRLGTERAPLKLELSAGTLAQARPPPLPRWLFIATASVAAASGAAAGGLGIAFNATQDTYRRQVSGGATVDGAALAQQRLQGEQFATATNGALIAFGVSAIAAAIMVPLTNFSPDPP